MPATLDAPHLLTVPEAAALLRLHPRTLRNYIRDGKLNAKKVGAEGRTFLLDQRDVLGLLQDVRPSEADTESGPQSHDLTRRT